jgi:hypothetical protein
MLLTLRATTVLRCRICRPHIVVRLAPIARGIFARHRAVHVMSIVLGTVHLMHLPLRTRYAAIHRAIIDAAVNGTIIHAMIIYRPRGYIVSAEFSRP